MECHSCPFDFLPDFSQGGRSFHTQHLIQIGIGIRIYRKNGCFAVLTQILNYQTGQRGFSNAALSGYSNNLCHSFLLML